MPSQVHIEDGKIVQRYTLDANALLKSVEAHRELKNGRQSADGLTHVARFDWAIVQDISKKTRIPAAELIKNPEMLIKYAKDRDFRKLLVDEKA